MRWPFALCALLVLALSAHAAIVTVDYSLDTGSLFSSNPTAKAAVEAAAADIGNAITHSLGAVPTDIYSGTNGSTTAQFDWKFNVTNPSTGAIFTQNTFSFSVNSLTVYAGWRPLTGLTLGVGGPAGGGFTFSGTGSASQWVGAVAAAESASNAAMSRRIGPVIGRLSGSSTLGGTTANYSVRYGPMLGSLSLDSDSDNDGSADSAAVLANYWHYDHTTAVAAGKNDLYSVALHEILHGIGFGVSDTWDSLHSGTTWTGQNVIALQGTGANMVSADGGHIASGAMSTRISDGVAQEAVMDPSLTVGTRKYLTQLDLAFLNDLFSIPEPSSGMLAAAAGLFLLLNRRRHARPALA